MCLKMVVVSVLPGMRGAVLRIEKGVALAPGAFGLLQPQPWASEALSHGPDTHSSLGQDVLPWLGLSFPLWKMGADGKW